MYKHSMNYILSTKSIVSRHLFALGLIIGLVAVMDVSAAQAQTPTPIGQFGDWNALTASSEQGKVCYIVSQPKDQQPKGVNRDQPLLFVSNRPGENIRNEFNLIIGYPFRSQASASVIIGNETYKLYTHESYGWIQKDEDEPKLVAAMKAGTTMIVTGVSRRGTNTRDRYSLSGVTAALAAIDKACP